MTFNVGQRFISESSGTLAEIIAIVSDYIQFKCIKAGTGSSFTQDDTWTSHDIGPLSYWKNATGKVFGGWRYLEGQDRPYGD